jgi:HD-GYP domain-containing protein (c-di-GMP phosphodiesterase class II)
VHLFAPLHDVGKIGIPDRVLLKPGALTDEEWVIMRSHVAIGETLVTDMGADLSLGDSLAYTVMHNVVSCHHERGDGSGYPRGLTAGQIPMEARLVAVADVYDALSTCRPYKVAWSEEACVAELRSQALLGRLDTLCVEALIAAKVQREDIQAKFSEEHAPAITAPMGAFCR